MNPEIGMDNLESGGGYFLELLATWEFCFVETKIVHFKKFLIFDRFGK